MTLNRCWSMRHGCAVLQELFRTPTSCSQRVSFDFTTTSSPSDPLDNGNHCGLRGVKNLVSRYRIALPASMGLVACGLMAWEHHNNEVIAAMGMAWDTGAPIWPFQTPEIILALLNAPAYLLAAPAWLVLDLHFEDQRNPALLLAIVLLWTCIGIAIDFDLLSSLRRSGGKSATITLSLAALIFSFVGVGALISGVQWWSRYGQHSLVSALIFARIVSFAPL